MDIQTYIKPELLILVPVLYVLGAFIKRSRQIANCFIPSILGCCGVICSAIYTVGTEGFSVLGAFTSITQGILVAGAAVYANQLAKQAKKGKWL